MIRGLSPAHDLLTVTSLFAIHPHLLSFSFQTAKEETKFRREGGVSGQSGSRRKAAYQESYGARLELRIWTGKA